MCFHSDQILLLQIPQVPFLNKGTLAIIANDESQFVQNITTTIGLCFSILSGQTYYLSLIHI